MSNRHKLNTLDDHEFEDCYGYITQAYCWVAMHLRTQIDESEQNQL